MCMCHSLQSYLIKVCYVHIYVIFDLQHPIYGS